MRARADVDTADDLAPHEIDHDEVAAASVGDYAYRSPGAIVATSHAEAVEALDRAQAVPIEQRPGAMRLDDDGRYMQGAAIISGS